VRISTAALLVAASTGVACGGGSPTPPPATPAVTVQAPVSEASLTTLTLTPEAAARLGIQTATVERQSIAATRTVGGELVPPPGAETVVAAPFAGTLGAAGDAPQAGSAVERGRPLFHLLPLGTADRDARVEADRAVNEALARRELAARRVQRAETLVRDGAGSRRAVEEAQSELAVADADLKAARDRLSLAERGLAPSGGLVIQAPFGGLIRNIHAAAGQSVAAGTPLVDLVRLDTLWVQVPLYVGEATEVDARAPARIVSLGDRPGAEGVAARPVAAPPSADATTAAVNLYFSLPNPEGALRPGQRVGVRLTRRTGAPRLVVPRAALLIDAFGGTWVYEATDARVFVRRRVAVADLVGDLAVLDQGPEPGVTVVTAGAAELFGTEFGAGR
jgi:RND family efflux transporter MFP subunit